MTDAISEARVQARKLKGPVKIYRHIVSEIKRKTIREPHLWLDCTLIDALMWCAANDYRFVHAWDSTRSSDIGVAVQVEYKPPGKRSQRVSNNMLLSPTRSLNMAIATIPAHWIVNRFHAYPVDAHTSTSSRS